MSYKLGPTYVDFVQAEEQHPIAHGPNYYAVYFEDPNKFKVEVVAPDEQLGHEILQSGF